jgi:hypothetical protein
MDNIQNGGMPRGAWLGPYISPIHINDPPHTQTTLCLLQGFEFIDDVTAIEVIDGRHCKLSNADLIGRRDCQTVL